MFPATDGLAVTNHAWAANPFSCGPVLDGKAPIAVRPIDIEEGVASLQLPRSRSGEPYQALLGLVRRNGRPLGWVTLPVTPAGAVSLEGLAPAAEAAGELFDAPAVLNGHRPDAQPSEALGPPGAHNHLTASRVPEPLLTVVVATCANVRSVVRCVQAILEGVAGRCEIVVVENRPSGSTVGLALEERFRGDERICYVEEHRRGLSRARNAGLDVARGELVAFTDDDVVVDPGWVPAIRAAFAASSEVGCVTGLILPLELETPTQVLVERFASFGKGFDPRVYSLDRPPPEQPLFPYTAGYFGSGANMAFRTDVLRGLGGFDAALGTGTRARGGEDLDICIRLLHAGGHLAYEPRAIVWHRHPDTEARLRRQVFDYGAGMGAMLSKQLLTGPDRWTIVSRAPQGIRYFTDPESRKNASRGSVFPGSLNRLERAGLLYGPVAYLASRLGPRR
jgi:GT2 family glycosyltransferase